MSGVVAVPPSRRQGAASAPVSSSTRGGSLAAYRWEVVKLLAQVKTQGTLLLCLLAPFLFVAALKMQTNTPADTLFGRWVHDSGFAIPLVVLGFAGQWALPALTSVVAGDIFVSEDRHGTWRTILTRSLSRSQLFAGKAFAAMTFSVAATVVLGLSSLAAGAVLIGRQPVVGLSGSLVEPGRAAVLVVASWASVLPPVLAFTALGLLLSVATRSTAVGIGGPVVLGLLMQLASLANGPAIIRELLVTTPFAAWHGFWTTPTFTGPFVHGLFVSAGYFVACLAGAYLVLRHRDFTEG